ncbi:hypothetical protein FB645_003880 [Coemansia sp. IMI 203386]|nr:hypothetical protein FB645_003880 [Coemansia sp. IMI 203386]
MSFTKMERSMTTTTRMLWSRRRRTGADSDSEEDINAFGGQTKINNSNNTDVGININSNSNGTINSNSAALGLNIPPPRTSTETRTLTRPTTSYTAMASPTVPRDRFFENIPLPAVPLPLPTPTQAQPPSMIAKDSEIFIDHTLAVFDIDFAPVNEGRYSLNTSFLDSWDIQNAPPVPQLPNTYNNANEKQSRASDDSSEGNFSFPRPKDEDLAQTMSTSLPHKSPRAKKASRAAEMAAAGTSNVPSPSKQRPVSGRQMAPPPKRNYSLPAALAKPVPQLELQSYEFACIERLERKWADVKTESTRMLSSAIYKYYFSRGEWSEFVQVFPNKILEVWEEFYEKLSSTELVYVNTILVSQNPFSSEDGLDQEKHIPILARTIPLSQAVRTMVFSEDMRSRESYSSQGSNGPEIDQEFADWVIARFNSLRGSVTSPTEASFAEKKAKRQSRIIEMTEAMEISPLAERTVPSAPPAPSAPPMPTAPSAPVEPSAPSAPMAPPAPPAPPAVADQAVEAEEPAERPKTSSERTKKSKKKSGSLHASKSMSEKEKPRRKKTISGDEPSTSSKRESTRSKRKSKEPLSATVSRRPSLDLSEPSRPRPKTSKRSVSSTHHFASGSEPNLAPFGSKYSAMSDSESMPRSSSSKSRRHTHNFYTSEGNEFVVLSDTARSTRRITRELQMKDLPPLPPNAAAIGEMAKLAESNASLNRSTTLTKTIGKITHFGSNIELGRRKEMSMDKPRSSSMTVDHFGKMRPSTSHAGSSEPRSSKSSASSADRLTANYDWRMVPADGDGVSWGFRISPLVYLEPMERIKTAAASYVIHTHMDTMNRRELPDPQKAAAAFEGQQQQQQQQQQKPAKQRTASVSHPAPESNCLSRQITEQPVRSDRPQANLGLGIGAGAAPSKPTDADTASTAASKKPAELSVRGVLYELAYLSTQSKQVWSKSDKIFGKMLKSGLEVNRIAEQDFYDFCVDELLKASSDAFHDLQAMGNKAVAKQLYESFNVKLSVLLSGGEV